MAVTTEIDKFLYKLEDLVLRLAHTHDDVSTEFLRAKDILCLEHDVPVFLPLVGRLHALAAGTIKQLRRRCVQRDREDIRAKVPGALHIVARHGRGIGQDRHGNRIRVDLVGPLLQHRERVLLRSRVRNHRDAHAMERALLGIFRHDVHDVGHRHCRPVHPDEVTIGVVAFSFAMTREAAISAIRTATLRIGQQQVQAARAFAAVHPATHDTERDGGGIRQLHVVRRLHVGSENIVVRQVDTFGRYVVRLDVFAVPAIDGRLFRKPWLHHVIRVVVVSRIFGGW